MNTPSALLVLEGVIRYQYFQSSFNFQKEARDLVLMKSLEQRVRRALFLGLLESTGLLKLPVLSVSRHQKKINLQCELELTLGCCPLTLEKISWETNGREEVLSKPSHSYTYLGRKKKRRGESESRWEAEKL